MPRRLERPEPPLSDEVIRLEPLGQADHAELLALIDDDAVRAFTRIPNDADAAFVHDWISRYERGWEDGSCAGFGARTVGNSSLVAFAAFVGLELDAGQGEIGYAVGRSARGQGIAGRVLDLLTGWGFTQLGLTRIELVIDVTNPGSARVAERSGYRLEGVKRSMAFKEGRRIDSGFWSRLRDDPPVP